MAWTSSFILATEFIINQVWKKYSKITSHWCMDVQAYSCSLMNVQYSNVTKVQEVPDLLFGQKFPSAPAIYHPHAECAEISVF